MERIRVFDRVFEKDEVHQANHIIYNKGWCFGHKAVHRTDVMEPPFWSMDLNDEPFFTKYLKKRIEETVGRKLRLLRVYANGQVYGQDGAFHRDSPADDAYTFVLYLTDIPKNDNPASGHLCIQLPEYPCTLCYEPRFNRGIFFPANYMHRALAFTRFVTELRVVVAWKFVLVGPTASLPSTPVSPPPLPTLCCGVM